VTVAGGRITRVAAGSWLGAAGAVLVGAGLVSLWAGRPDAEQAIWALVVGAGYAVVGAAAGRRPQVPAGRLFALTAATLLAVPLLQAAGFRLPATGLLGLAVGVLIPAGLLRVVRPGRSTAGQRVAEAAVLGSGVAVAVTLLVPDEPARTVSWWAFVGSVVAAGWLRFEHTSGRSRRQLLWLVLGVSSSVLAVLFFLFAADGVAIGAVPLAVVVALVSLLLPLSVGVAALAPDVVDVRAVIGSVVVAGLMASTVVAVYSGVLATFALLGGEPKVGIQGLLVTAIAVGFHPMLVRVRGFVDEVLFGGRPDPVRTLSRLGGQLSAGSTPHDWLETLRVALGAPAVLLRQDGVPLAATGELADAAPTVVTPLRVGAEVVGELVVGLAPQQLRPPPTRRAVLELVAGPLAQALRAARLSEQLQASRGRVVAALEEERRRMRRDLHDGLGPTLTGIAYSADAARNLLPAGSESAAAELRALRADAAEAIAEIRRIVYGLRPKALDELGLLGALRQRLERLRVADGRPLVVTFAGPSQLPELPAAVEVVAYRVVLEAVTNVARHAGVDRARVELTLDEPDQLGIAVSGQGDGPGEPAAVDPWTPGVGLTSMRERVEQIGGVLTVEAGPAGGLVRARVPTTLELPD
jgi:signal transduction histidine kinase